jgi:hypothetical protein
MKHYPATVTPNAINARNIVRSVVGKGCNYADGRKNGVRYKWFFERNRPASVLMKGAIEDALYNANIKNWSVSLHINKYGYGDAISVTIYA